MEEVGRNWMFKGEKHKHTRNDLLVFSNWKRLKEKYKKYLLDISVITSIQRYTVTVFWYNRRALLLPLIFTIPIIISLLFRWTFERFLIFYTMDSSWPIMCCNSTSSSCADRHITMHLRLFTASCTHKHKVDVFQLSCYRRLLLQRDSESYRRPWEHRLAPLWLIYGLSV